MTELHTAYPTAAAHQKSNTTLIIVAVSLGILTVLLTTIYTSRIRAAVRDKMVTAYELKIAKAPGDKFKARNDVREVQKLEGVVESYGEGSVLDRQGVENWDGKPFMQSAAEGQLLTAALFAEAGARGVMKIGPDMVGCPLVINSRAAPGLLRPEMYISILGTFTPPGQLPTTKLVMERVRVAAVGTQTDPEAGARASYGSITVEVTQHEALALVTIAKHIGKDGFDILILPNNHSPKMLGINPEVLKLVGMSATGPR